MVAGAASTVVPVAYSDWATRALVIERRTLSLPRWDVDGFRVVVLADMHANSWQRSEVAATSIDLALAETPDLILLAGDFVNSWTGEHRSILRQLLAKFDGCSCPVFAVLGNHDYWSGGVYGICQEFSRSNVRLLQNEDVKVGEVLVAGVDDALMRRQNPRFLGKHTGEGSIITMLHEPDYVKCLPEHVGLMVAGHSHGGQVCLPGGYAIHTPAGAHQYVKGYYPGAKVPLYVTRGVGTTGPNWRFFCRPEVSVLTLNGPSVSTS